MKITEFDDTYTLKLGSGETTLTSGTSGGSNSAFGGDVVGSAGSLSVVGLRQTVSLSSNIGGTTIGDVLTIIQTSPRLAMFATPSNSGGGSFGSNATEVGNASSPGAGTNIIRDTHVHKGVHSLAKSGSSALFGDVTLSGGSNVTLTQSGQDISIASTGGGGGTRAFGLDRAAVDGTYGDEFAGASLDVKWSRQNQIAGQETYQAGGLASILRVAHGSVNAAEYIYQTAPNGTNETWEASCSWFQETATNQMFAITMVTTAGTGVAALVYDNTNGLYLANVVSHVYSSALAQNVNLKPAPTYYQSGGRIWLKLRKASGLYGVSYSFDGQVYSAELTGTPGAFTPTRIGIGRILGTNANSIANWHWFDKTA